MIPKKIHYCWFGNGEKPKSVVKCIESWKKHCPDYEIIEWNEANVNLDVMPFVKEAYEARKYAFVSDVIRLWALYNEGGIYFDTDVEVIKSFDNLLNNKGFAGFETPKYVASGLCIAAEKGNEIIKEMYDYYKDIRFINSDGTLNKLGCPIVNTKVFVNHGLVLNGKKQSIDGFLILPIEYFNPYNDITGKLNVTNNTHSIHWYSKSWMSKKTILRSKLSKPLHRLQEKLNSRGRNE